MGQFSRSITSSFSRRRSCAIIIIIVCGRAQCRVIMTRKTFVCSVSVHCISNRCVLSVEWAARVSVRVPSPSSVKLTEAPWTFFSGVASCVV